MERVDKTCIRIRFHSFYRFQNLSFHPQEKESKRRNSMSQKMASVASPHQKGNPKAFDDDKEKVQFKPRDLNIVWGGDTRYWVPENEVNQKPAELQQVCWLEVTGSAKNINPEKDYEVIFNLSLTPDAFGWGSCPVSLMVKRGKKGIFASRRYQLRSSRYPGRFEISCKSVKADKKNQESDHELYFGLYEVWSGKWKGGLQIHHVIVKELSGN